MVALLSVCPLCFLLVQLFGSLFFLLQTNPMYLSKLTREVSMREIDSKPTSCQGMGGLTGSWEGSVALLGVGKGV